MAVATMNEATESAATEEPQLQLSSVTRSALAEADEIIACCKPLYADIDSNREKLKAAKAQLDEQDREIAELEAEIRAEYRRRVEPMKSRRSGIDAAVHRLREEIKQDERGIVGFQDSTATQEDLRTIKQLNRDIDGLREMNNRIAYSMANVPAKDRHAESDNPTVRQAFANMNANKLRMAEKTTAISYLQRGGWRAQLWKQLDRLRSYAMRRVLSEQERYEVEVIEKRLGIRRPVERESDVASSKDS